MTGNFPDEYCPQEKGLSRELVRGCLEEIVQGGIVRTGGIVTMAKEKSCLDEIWPLFQLPCCRKAKTQGGHTVIHVCIH